MTQDISQNNKRIAKNTIMLYIRMAIVTFVGLYTGRVVLNVLGVQDFGIYNVVGGVVAMLNFLNTSMSAATSRYITYEMGKNNYDKLQLIFSAALEVHIIIAIVVLLLAETLGLWFMSTKLVIPEGRMFAAQCVYQLSIMSTIVSITQVPYNASILAHEHMNIYAYIEILNAALKLGAISILSYGEFDKLILYAFLTFIISCLIALIYRIYCMRKFNECKFRFIKDRNIIKPILAFSSLDLYGNVCGVVRQQGINFLINNYFGVALNAAAGIAGVVSGVIAGFTGSVSQAFRPAIIKNYAVGNIKNMQNLMINSVSFSLLLLSCIAVPVYIEVNYILGFWLGNVPEYANIFTRLLLLTCIPNIVNAVIVTAVHATGKIKFMSYITGTVFLFNVPLLYILYEMKLSVEYSYFSALFIMLCVTLSNILIAKYEIPQFSILSFLWKVIKSLFLIMISAIPSILFTFYMEESFLRVFLLVITYLLMLMVIVYNFVLDVNQRSTIQRSFKTFIL